MQLYYFNEMFTMVILNIYFFFQAPKKIQIIFMIFSLMNYQTSIKLPFDNLLVPIIVFSGSLRKTNHLIKYFV